MKTSKAEFDAANRRAEAKLRRFPRAMKARYEQNKDRVVLTLSTGLELAIPRTKVQGLRNAKAEQLHLIRISPSGFGIHFPKLDADIYLPALLQGFLGAKRWMAGELGKVGGSTSSAAKAAAARANGKLGGRPRKAHASA